VKEQELGYNTYAIEKKRGNVMKETIFLYHMKEDIQNIIEVIAKQLDIDVRMIKEEDKCQKMGYILGFDGYERLEDQEITEDMSKEFMFFAGMTSEQLDILLDVFKMANLPFIPYKAMLTENNVEYLFYQLYANVAHEYAQMIRTH